ncbi:MAG: 2,3-bisphosphoglycerate-independent phosphoglycerate mutase [Myxococcales bacterium]|nr:2,3-bisphosphoglycerate-independent phosphoglycerate mutase [Myxococcales bacterium]
MDWTLKSSDRFKGAKGPVVLVILDGVGEGLGDEGDAVQLAHTPTFDALRLPGMVRSLRAHGTSVGLPSNGDMGNSEVGHNALGCGRIHDQGASLVGKAIASGTLYQSDAWKGVMQRAGQGGSVHFIALLSDGGVHSHIDHLVATLRQAASTGAKALYMHALLDGRDVPPTSAMQYVEQLEGVLSELRDAGVDARVASGGGRMSTTMDRYEAEWGMVERGWNAHVNGKASHRFASIGSAVEGLRAQSDGIGDQDLPTFVIVGEDGDAVAPIKDGDAVVLMNFRGDRALEICQAFESDDFGAFDRGRRPDVFFAGLMEYDGDLHIPRSFLIEPPTIEETMGEFLARNQVSQLAISETQKYGHVTYFWNGNRSGKFDDRSETYIEIPSDVVPFEQHPWMKAAEITDTLIAELRGGKHRFARVNYANGDMVGHTGDLRATVMAVQVLDMQLARLQKVVDELDGILLITADHGNADEMLQHGKDGSIVCEGASGAPMVKTSHTLNAVPLIIHDPNCRGQYQLAAGNPDAGIANLMATCIDLLGYVVPADIQPSLLSFKS